jgi:hypothetical protein
MALEPIPKAPNLSPGVFDEHTNSKETHPVKNRWFRAPILTRTTGRPSNDTVEQIHDLQDRPTKRQRIDSPFHRNAQANPPNSRDNMPPPTKPLLHMTSVRKIIPSLRKKLSHNRSMPTSQQAPRHDNDTEMSESGLGGGATTSQIREEVQHVPTQSGMHQNEPLMSGAMPAKPEYGLADPRESTLLRSVGIPEDKSDFTFRAASPVRTGAQINRYQPLQLPKEPSYMRLMDSISRDSDFEIGLKDPRGDANGHATYATGTESQDFERRQPWSLRHVPSSRSGGKNTAQHYVRKDGLITPTTRRVQQPGPPVESVVSPFFRASHLNTRVLSGIGITEPRNSSSLFSNSRSPNAQTRRTTSQYHKPVDSNGLPVLQSPLDSRNESTWYMHVERLPGLSQYSQGNNLTPKGFFARPEIEQRPCMENHIQTSSFGRPPVSQQQTVQPRSAIQFPSFIPNLSSRARQLASAVPPIISGQYPTRGRPQWEPLQRLGVKSSRQTHTAGQFTSRLGSRISSSSSRRIIRR